jgi:hypothetical protein
MNDDFANWLFATLFFFLVGWFAVGFIAMDFVWPLSTEPSRAWFIFCACLGLGFMVYESDQRKKEKGE